MTKLILILILSLCSIQTEKDKRIEKFEFKLGREKALVLDKAVLVLDSIVSDMYETGNINSNYQCFLNDIAQNNIDGEAFYKRKEIINLNNQFKVCGLRNDVYLQLDTSFFENDCLVNRYSTLNSDSLADDYENEIREFFPTNHLDKSSIDSIINKKAPALIHNYSGNYFSALSLVQENDSLLINYLEIKELLGSISSSIIAGLFLNNKADFNEYFTKRIFTIEITMWE